MYEDGSQNYDQEIHEKISHTWYTLFPATSFIAMCRLGPIAQLQTQLIRMKGTIFCCDCKYKIRIPKKVFFLLETLKT